MSAGRSTGPRVRVGLGARLMIALLATSVATLAAATLTMVPLLAQRLEADRLADLRDLAGAARPALRAVPAAELRPRSPQLDRLADVLQRRVGGRIVIYDERNRVLVDTAPQRGEPAVPDPARERALALRRRSLVTAGEVGARAFAVTVVRRDDRPLMLVLTKRLDDTRAAAAVVRSVLPLGLLAGVIVAAALAAALGRRLLRRLARLHRDARALGEEGLQHPVSVTGSDEVAVVAYALEDMRGRLIQQEAARQAFVATASHELRTPLASLQATLDLLKEEMSNGSHDAAVATARADTALRQTHRLVGLASDLLDLSRIDGQVRLHPEPLDLRELAEAVSREFAARLQPSGRALAVEGDLTLAVADPGALARIVRIVLENACAYGEGTVTVTARAGERTATVTVHDEGPGVPDEERERIFGRFTRGEASRRATGSGLGLPIARGLARMMGGDLQLAPASRRGATFVLSLPAWQGEDGP